MLFIIFRPLMITLSPPWYSSSKALIWFLGKLSEHSQVASDLKLIFKRCFRELLRYMFKIYIRRIADPFHEIFCGFNFVSLFVSLRWGHSAIEKFFDLVLTLIIFFRGLKNICTYKYWRYGEIRCHDMWNLSQPVFNMARMGIEKFRNSSKFGIFSFK